MSEAGPLLAGRCGVVLGVSGENSMGFRIARALAALGAEVGVTYRPARAEACAALAEGAGLRHTPLDADDEASVARAFDLLAMPWGRIDFVVHTLVTVPEGVLARPLLELDREAFHTVLDVAAHSLVVACRHALPWLERSAHPRVVALTSAGAERALPSYHAVGIAKAALAATVRYLAHELGPRGVLCNLVSFSLVATDGAARAVGAENAAATRAHIARRAPTRRPVEPDEVAHAVAWLVSPLCANVTGTTLTVDGGLGNTYF